MDIADVHELVRACRADVDEELIALKASIEQHAWTPERARNLADEVLERAIPQIEDRMLLKLKISVGESTLGIAKRAVQILGVFVLAATFYISSHKWPWQ
jgi:hypothetical protein